MLDFYYAMAVAPPLADVICGHWADPFYVSLVCPSFSPLFLSTPLGEPRGLVRSSETPTTNQNSPKQSDPADSTPHTRVKTHIDLSGPTPRNMALHQITTRTGQTLTRGGFMGSGRPDPGLASAPKTKPSAPTAGFVNIFSRGKFTFL